MSGGEAADRSEEHSDNAAGETKDSTAQADAWTNPPPAPAFPQYLGVPSPGPSSPEGPQPYAYGFPGYPPQDFGGVHQPPPFPGTPGPEYAGYPPYQPPEHTGPPPYEGPPPNDDQGEPAPADDHDLADAERTQFVEQRPAAETTQFDPVYEGYSEGGYPSYAPYPPPQFSPSAGAGQAGPPHPGQPFYGGQPGTEQAPPPYQAAPYAPRQDAEPGMPYPQQPYSQYPYGPEQGRPQAPYPGQGFGPPPGAEQGPPFAPLPDAYAQQPEAAGQTADSLSADTLLRGRRHAPSSGWRRAVYKASGGMIHPGESPQELRRRELLARVRTPVAGGHHRVAVMSLKGGVGKTTTTVGLGSTLSSMRGDRVIAVDANPDRGTLSDKVRLETATTVRDLLNEHRQIQRYADVRAYTSQSSSRLEVLASDRDPAVSEAFSEEDYRTVAHVLEHFYSICLTDCGTGLLHSAMAGVLGLANQLVLVSSPSVDGARSASATLDWLEAHHYGDLVRGGVVVLSMVRSRSRSTVDLDRLQAHFESRCRAVVRIPYDPHLEEGAEVELDQLSPAAQDAYLVLAATVADGFAWPR